MNRWGETCIDFSSQEDNLLECVALVKTFSVADSLQLKIERVAEPGDKRSLPVGLTRQGIATATQAFTADMAFEKAKLRALSPQEQADLILLLRKLMLALA